MRRALPFIRVLAPAATIAGLVACTDTKRDESRASSPTDSSDTQTTPPTEETPEETGDTGTP